MTIEQDNIETRTTKQFCKLINIEGSSALNMGAANAQSFRNLKICSSWSGVNNDMFLVPSLGPVLP